METTYEKYFGIKKVIFTDMVVEVLEKSFNIFFVTTCDKKPILPKPSKLS